MKLGWMEELLPFGVCGVCVCVLFMDILRDEPVTMEREWDLVGAKKILQHGITFAYINIKNYIFPRCGFACSSFLLVVYTCKAQGSC